ncbi:MAG: YifB family Mg chelatase-like AAA ATPase [Candidatus Paceibacterota bacterium]|jgi:magnesium chelatase family protein
MLSKIYSAQILGLGVHIVEVETDISRGIKSFNIVGLPDKAVEEAKDRINAAIKNSGLVPPNKGNKKTVVSLAPADVKKEGPIFDLAIALGSLLASGQIAFNPKGKIFIGELALDGEIRPIKGTVLIAKEAKRSGFKEIYTPAKNASEAALVDGIKVYGCKNFKEVIEHLDETPTKEEKNKPIKIEATPKVNITKRSKKTCTDFSEIKGQETAKRGLEIAAAGGHNMIMYGPPGTGKTMLAKALAGILPPLDENDALEVTSIYSASGILDDIVSDPPFRNPHHTSSYISLVGGGTWPKPGEITLAHHGVLFLDEFPEFEKRVIESLRQPLEDKIVTISRAKGTMRFPADFILIAAMNPCPCGNRGSDKKECICSQGAIMNYQRKISGPIADRIDIWVEVPAIEYKKLSEKSDEKEISPSIQERVGKARSRQKERFNKLGLEGMKTNSQMGTKEVKNFCPLSESLTSLLNMSAEKLMMSPRAYFRVIKLARTIADLDNSENIEERHLLEALQYRPKAE